MRVTDVRIVPARDRAERLQAFANVTFDDCFVVRGIKIIQAANGLMVAMPSRRKPDGTYQDLAHPIHAGARGDLEDAVLGAYAQWQQQGSVPER